MRSPKTVTRTINGQEVLLDKSIADIICYMNEKGYATLWCCSGIKSEHPKNDNYCRAYIRCDYTNDYNQSPFKIQVLIKCLRNIGNIELIENSFGHFLDIEFTNSLEKKFKNRKFKMLADKYKTADKLQIFYSRFKELTK